MKTTFVYAAFAAILALPVSAASVVVGTSDGTIGELDSDTGAVSNTFDTGSQSWFDIAIDDNGNAYGLNNGTSLYSIDLGLQNATLVGGTGVQLNGLAFGPTALYATGGNGLYTVDTSSGNATLVGSGVGGSFSSSGDIAFGGGTTFYGTSTSSCGSLGGDCLWSIDAATGAGTAIGGIGVSAVYGLSLIDGTLFGLSAANDLYSIDTTTGAGSFLQSYSISGQTFGSASGPSEVGAVPVPAALPLMLVGLGALGLASRRRAC